MAYFKSSFPALLEIFVRLEHLLQGVAFP